MQRNTWQIERLTKAALTRTRGLPPRSRVSASASTCNPLPPHPHTNSPATPADDDSAVAAFITHAAVDDDDDDGSFDDESPGAYAISRAIRPSTESLSALRQQNGVSPPETAPETAPVFDDWDPTNPSSSSTLVVGPEAHVTEAYVLPVHRTRRTRGFSTSPPDEEVAKFSMEQQRHYQQVKQRRLRLSALLLIGAVVTAIGVIMMVTGKQPEDFSTLAPSVAPTRDVLSLMCVLPDDGDENEMSERYIRLHSTVATQLAIINNKTTTRKDNIMAMVPETNATSTSQHLALRWMADFDTFMYETIASTDEEILQRFALTTIFMDLVRPKLCVDGGIRDDAEAGQATFHNWLGGKHECDWEYITCTTDGDDDKKEVQTLRLNKVGLTGQLPTELALLTSLGMMDLSVNKLTGQIPFGLWTGMSKLEELHLQNNGLRGPIFGDLTNLRELRQVDLKSNMFTGTIPNRLDLPNLKSLLLGSNDFGGPFPELSSLTDLALDLSQLDLISGTIPTTIWSLTNLSLLNIPLASLHGTVPTTIGFLTDLVTLRLNSNSFTGMIPSEMGLLTNLVSLSLTLNQFVGPVPGEVCAIEKNADNFFIFVDAGVSCACCT